MPIVETVGVTRVFGTDGVVTALDDVSISVSGGEFVAIQGPSGCGKSTLLHLLGGLDMPTAGTVRFGGVDLAALTDNERTRLRRRSIGIVLPIVELVPTLTTWENVAISLLLDGRAMAEGRARATELLDAVRLSDRTHTVASRLSTGEAQRVAVARALYNEPELLLADEPTSFLDSVRSDEIVGLLRTLANDGRTIVMATHDARAAAFADRSIRLLDGHVVQDVC
ncbi:ABC transporter ATP-binding protein [Candidatus Poriferisodalis sp.]|uniref:ABC transporter ATP-binding protein n=1 Tax=Candidatus Poriferisodalis sp. TaxID=3101277 RepID=UPI003AF87AB5